MLLRHVGGLSSARIVLASGSPRRRELLGSMGLKFEVRAAAAGACCLCPPACGRAAPGAQGRPPTPRAPQVCVSTFEETLPHERFPRAADYAVETGAAAERGAARRGAGRRAWLAAGRALLASARRARTPTPPPPPARPHGSAAQGDRRAAHPQPAAQGERQVRRARACGRGWARPVPAAAPSGAARLAATPRAPRPPRAAQAGGPHHQRRHRGGGGRPHPGEARRRAARQDDAAGVRPPPRPPPARAPARALRAAALRRRAHTRLAPGGRHQAHTPPAPAAPPLQPERLDAPRAHGRGPPRAAVGRRRAGAPRQPGLGGRGLARALLRLHHGGGV